MFCLGVRGGYELVVLEFVGFRVRERGFGFVL